MSATAEKRPLASAMFWPDVTEEISLIENDLDRQLAWDGAAYACLDSNGFPSSVIERRCGSEYRELAVRFFLKFVSDHFEPVADDEPDGG